MVGENKTNEKNNVPMTPSEFMRARRPHLFSDSTTFDERVVTKEVLSHHLDTLTNRSEETVFAELAKRLVEKFISPNVRPQTGPVGGGDGKTDAETYPVKDVIAERWFLSDPGPAEERWAFAFSAKKDWRGKVHSDVKSIESTERDYARVYFVSNQFVPAKDSAAVQDQAKKKYGINLTILDRTWILDRFFEHDSLDIAIKVLGLAQGTNRETTKLGPRDLERSEEITALEKAIGDGSKYEGTFTALAEDCLRAAILSRGLERPRAETEGRFMRAIRIARNHNLTRQELSATYNFAWTSYFWFDDISAMNSMYDDVERLAIDSEFVDEVENVSNLFQLVRNSVAFGTLSERDARLTDRKKKLVESLERIRSDAARPNNALHGHALLLLARLVDIAHDQDAQKLDELWRDFKEVIEKSKGLGTFPFESIAESLTEVGQFVPESAAFDDLYEVLTDSLVSRKSEGEAAMRNSQRAFQKLEKGLPYEAIRWFGRSVGLLAKEEYQSEFIVALLGSSEAYEAAGLRWAARNYALAAASQEFGAYRRSGSILDINPAALSRWFVTEMQLGIVPLIISAYELGAIVRNARSQTDEQREHAAETQFQQCVSLGALLLKTRIEDLPALVRFPDPLDRLGLDQARLALLFRMGREDTLRREGSVPADEDAAGYYSFFVNWLAKAENWGLPSNPEYLLEQQLTIRSRVVGCEISVTCLRSSYSLGLGAAILGSLEALLATSLNHSMFPRTDKFEIRLSQSEDAMQIPDFRFLYEDGMEVCFVTHKAVLEYSEQRDFESFNNWLRDLVVQILTKVAVPNDLDGWGIAVLGKENAFTRAIMFSNVPIMYESVFGQNELSIDNWIDDGDESYEISPTAPTIDSSEITSSEEAGPLKFGEGDPPEEMYNLERLKHTDIKTFSPLDAEKLDAAKWRATFFMCIPHPNGPPPVLGMAFAEKKPGKEVFQGLRRRFGFEDRDNLLRIAIIRGITISNPFAYVVSVGPNVENIEKSKTNIFQFVSRLNIMQPNNHENLNNFLSEFERHGRFLFVPAYISDSERPPEPFLDLGLRKYHLEIRDAWQIGENDPDMMALQPDDPPVIPVDEANAPVLKALAKLETIRKKPR